MRLRLHTTTAFFILLAGALCAALSAWASIRFASTLDPYHRVERKALAHAWRLSFIPEEKIQTWFECRGTGVRADEVWFTMWSGGTPGTSEGRVYISAGWPIPCLQMQDSGLPAWARSGTTTPGAFTGSLAGLNLPGFAGPAPAPTTTAKLQNWWIYGAGVGIRQYPLRPLPLAFAANTLIYALLALTLYVAFIRIRARRRAKNNQCVTCGYNRQGLPPTTACPECGAPHTSVTASPSHLSPSHSS